MEDAGEVLSGASLMPWCSSSALPLVHEPPRQQLRLLPEGLPYRAPDCLSRPDTHTAHTLEKPRERVSGEEFHNRGCKRGTRHEPFCCDSHPFHGREGEIDSVGGRSAQGPRRKYDLLVLQPHYDIRGRICDTARLLHAVEHEPSAAFCVVNTFHSRHRVERMRLSPGAERVLHLPNAGGNSLESEVLSFELLRQCYGAELCRSEMEIEYWPEHSKKTDYSVLLGGVSVGVSVTRAMKFGARFTREDAHLLLEKKLFGILVSTENVLKEHGWGRQILHIWATHQHVADMVEEEFWHMPQELRGNTIVVLTVCTRSSAPACVFTSNVLVQDLIFDPPAPALGELNKHVSCAQVEGATMA